MRELDICSFRFTSVPHSVTRVMKDFMQNAPDLECQQFFNTTLKDGIWEGLDLVEMYTVIFNTNIIISDACHSPD